MVAFLLCIQPYIGRRSLMAKIKFSPPIPKEHGSWGMVFIPFLTGVNAAGQFNVPALLSLLSVFFLFILRHPLLLIWRWWFVGKGAASAPIGAFAWLAAYAFFASAFIALLIFHYGLYFLIAFGAAFFVFLGLNLADSLGKSLRSYRAEFTGIAALTMTAPLSLYVSSGEVNSEGLYLWLLNYLFFSSTVFYVKMKVAAMAGKQGFDGLSGKIKLGWGCIAYHVMIIIFVWLLGRFGAVPYLAPFAFTPAIILAIHGVLKLNSATSIKSVGFLQVAHSLAFALIISWVYSFR